MKAAHREYFKIAALVLTGAFVLLLLAYIFVISPQKKTGKQLENQLAEKKQEYNLVFLLLNKYFQPSSGLSCRRQADLL